jgi:hypothetical protein
VRARSLTSVVGLLTLVSVLGMARAAAAQTGLGGSTGNTSFAPEDFRIVAQSTPGAAYQAFELQRLFNAANCRCNKRVYFFVTFSTSGFQKRGALPEGTVEFWSGYACNDNSTGLRASRCRQLYQDVEAGSGSSSTLSAFARNGGAVLTSSVQELSQYYGQPPSSTGSDAGTTSGTPGPGGAAACETGTDFPQSVWALVTYSGSVSYDVVVTQPFRIDLAAPPPVASLNVDPGNEALTLSWPTISSATTSDILGYQVLCDRAGQFQVFSDGTFTPGFSSCSNTVPSGTSGNVLALNQKFICSPLLSASTNSYRVKILQNDIPYGVTLLAIDSQYNARPFLPIVYRKPVKTLNFYDVYRNGDSSNQMPHDMPDPGGAGGGYCSVGTSRSATSVLGGGAAAVLLLAFGLMRARRRGRRGQ